MSEEKMPNSYKYVRQKDILFGIACSTLVCAFSVTAPIVGFFCLLLLPSIIIFYRIKLGRMPAGIITLSSLILMMFFVGNDVVDLFFLSGLMGLGYFIGEGVEKNLPIEKCIGYAAGMILLAAIAGIIVYGNITNAGPIGIVSGYIDKNLDATISLYKQIGMREEAIQVLSDAQGEIRYFLVRIIPALLGAGLLFAGWMNFLLALALLKRKNIAVQNDAPLNTWKAPDAMVWGIIVSIFLFLMPHAILKMIGLNGLIVLLTIYFFQGIAIVSFYFEKKRVPVLFRILCYTMIAIQQIFALIVIVLGLFDLWINFRRIGINNNNNQ